MKTKYYFKRIINNKTKFAVVLLIFIFTLTDFFMILRGIHIGHSALEPNRATFLSAYLNKGAQMLLFWYLPLYFLLIAADDCIEDYRLGYRNILITKWGKKSYFKANIIKGFAAGFILLFAPLVLNLLMTQIAFAGGTYTGFDLPTIETDFQQLLLTNCIYIVFVSFLCGVVSMGGVAIALALHNRFLAYPIVFLMWYLPSSIHQSIINALQPFTEYSLFYLLPTILTVIGLNLVAVLFAYIKVIKYDKI
jgi:hypothetical protein